MAAGAANLERAGWRARTGIALAVCDHHCFERVPIDLRRLVDCWVSLKANILSDVLLIEIKRSW